MGHTIRTAPSGPLLRGSVTGQSLLWNQETDEWDIEVPGGVLYVFTSADDIEAAFPAVAGVHTFDEAGRYVFAGTGINLGANSIQVTASRAILEGQNSTLLTSNADAPIIEGVGNLTLLDLRVIALESSGTSAGAVLFSGSQLRASRCTLQGGSATQYGLSITSGDAFLSQCDISGFKGLIPGGNTFASNCRLYTQDALGTAVSVDVNTGDLVLDGCQLTSCATALEINAAISRMVLSGCSGTAIGDALTWTAGTVGAATIDGCNFTCDNGITWAAADLPTLGLSVVGTVLNATTAALVGLTAADARFNLKACIDSAGLMVETAIVV